MDDFSVPDETLIFYSKKKAIINIVGFGAVICLAIAFALTDAGSYYIDAIWVIISLLIVYSSVKKLNNRKPIVILNAKGIQTIATPFYEWKQVEDEVVVKKYIGRGPSYYLQYNYATGSEKMRILGWDTKAERIGYLLQVYRSRSNSPDK